MVPREEDADRFEPVPSGSSIPLWMPPGPLRASLGFPSGSAVRRMPAMQEMRQELRVQFLGQEDPLEKEMTTHTSIPAWGNPMGSPWGGKMVRHNLATQLFC